MLLNGGIYDLPTVILTKSLFFPRLIISAIATSSISFFKYYFMISMISIFVTFVAYDAAGILPTVVTLGNFITKKLLNSPLATNLAHTDLF